MARPTTTRTNVPGYGPQQQGGTVAADTPALGVSLYNVGRGPSEAERLANALGLVVDSVTPAIRSSVARKAADETRLGMTGGEFSKESQYFARGATWAKAKAEVVKAESDWEKYVTENGLADASPDDFDSAQEKFFRERLGPLLNDQTAREAVSQDVLGLMLKQRQQHGQRMVEAETAEALADIGTVVDGAIKAERDLPADADSATRAAARARTQGELSKARWAMRGMIGGSAANQAFANMVIQKAIEAGDPTLLDALTSPTTDPETGTNLAPIAGIPSIGKQVDDARRQIARESELRDAAKERATEDARKQARVEARNSIAVNILDGRYSQKQVRDLVAAGVLDFEDARALDNFAEDLANDRGGGDEEGSLAALQMEARVRKGEAGIDDIMSSDLSVKDKRRLLSAAAATDNGVTRSLKGDLGRRFQPPRALGGEVNPADIVLQADVLREFDERVQNGEDPRKVYEDIKKANPEKFKQATPAVGKSVPTNVPGVSVQEIG
jgi:hypothetical protein